MNRETIIQMAQEAGLTNRQFDLICQAIDKADTATMEGDYMLDSDDCINVVRVMQALFDVTKPAQEVVIPQGYEIHELPPDYSGPVWIESQVRYLARKNTCASQRATATEVPVQEVNKSVADAEIKALYVESQGSDKGWLGIEGSYFIGGVVAARRQKKATKPAQYKDSTPQLSVGESSFESWFESYNPANKGDKQRSRDAYAAGMGDPLVAAAPAQGEPFGYFRPEPFGWTDCAEGDEGAIALYERPQEVGMTDEERADMACAVAAICTGTSSRTIAATAIDWTERALRAKGQT